MYFARTGEPECAAGINCQSYALSELSEAIIRNILDGVDFQTAVKNNVLCKAFDHVRVALSYVAATSYPRRTTFRNVALRSGQNVIVWLGHKIFVMYVYAYKDIYTL